MKDVLNYACAVPTRAKVLVVEDDPDLRRLYRDTLVWSDEFEVQEARSGFEALRTVDADPPDLVVLDLGLPGVDGFAVRQELAANVHTRDIPVLIVTGLSGTFEWLNADCVLRKPVSTEALVQAVRRCLKGGRPARSLEPL